MTELNEIAESMRKAGRSEAEIARAVDEIVDLQNLILARNYGIIEVPS